VSNEDGNYNFKLDWYLGVGFFVNAYFHDDYYEVGNNGLRNRRVTKGSFDFGLRVPVGLSWHIIKPIELFVGFVPGLGFWIGPIWDNRAHEYYTDFKPYPYLGGEIGLRFWIN
jgi:hypothetical protein